MKYSFDVKIWASFEIEVDRDDLNDVGRRELARGLAEDFLSLLDAPQEAVDGFNADLEGCRVLYASVEPENGQEDWLTDERS